MKKFDDLTTEYEHAEIVSWATANNLRERYYNLEDNVKSSWDEHGKTILNNHTKSANQSRNTQKRILNNILFFFWTTVITSALYLIALIIEYNG